jgi:hypothetical protein
VILRNRGCLWKTVPWPLPGLRFHTERILTGTGAAARWPLFDLIGGVSHAVAPIGLSSFDGRFAYGRIVHWKADRPKRILGTCPNRVIDPVNAARFMTAASTLQTLARSAASSGGFFICREVLEFARPHSRDTLAAHGYKQPSVLVG